MKKYFILILMLLLVPLGIIAQDGPGNVKQPYTSQSPNNESFKMRLTYKGNSYGNWGSNSEIKAESIKYDGTWEDYDAIRIGEYYWMTSNVINWTTMSNSWSAKKEDLEFYMMHLRLKNDQFNVDFTQKKEVTGKQGQFEKAYGRYYQLADIDGHKGGWDGPRHDGIGQLKSSYPNNNSHLFGWTVADRAAWQQLFGMCAVDNGTFKLSAIGTRIQLGPLRKDHPDVINKGKTWLTNDLAYDLGGYYNWAKTYWFEQTTNRYGFNLMPNGGKSNGAVWYNPWNSMGPELADNDPLKAKWTHQWAGWMLGNEDFYGLFYVAKQAWGTGSMDLHDVITFYPVDPKFEGNRTSNANPRDQFPISWGTRYGLRMARRLTPEELGYEVYYKPGKLNDRSRAMYYPDIEDEKGIIHFNYPLNSEDANYIFYNNYEKLPAGYLRGFYVQYKHPTYSANINQYTVPEIVRMARCVEDEWLMRKLNETWRTEPCDCNKRVILVDNMKLITDASPNYPNSFDVKRGTKFKVYVKATDMKDIKIGLFDVSGTQATKVSTFVSNKIDKYIFECNVSISQPNSFTPKVIMPYVDAPGSPSGFTIIERAPELPKLIDRLPLRSLANNPVNPATTMSAFRSIVEEHVFTDHFRYTPIPNITKPYHYMVNKSDSHTFKMSLHTGASVDLNKVKIGLLDQDSEKLVGVVSQSRINNEFTCSLNTANVESGKTYTAIPFYINNTDTVWISRTQGEKYIDRLPLTVYKPSTFLISNSLVFTDEDNSYLVEKNEPFYVLSDMQTAGEQVRIGLFSSQTIGGKSQLIPVEKISDDNNSDESFYECTVNEAPEGAYLVQAYIGDINDAYTLVERDQPYMIDRTIIQVGGNRYAPYSVTDRNVGINLALPSGERLVKHAVTLKEKFEVHLPLNLNTSNIRIGLFSEVTGQFLRDITHQEKASSPGVFECFIDRTNGDIHVNADNYFIVAAFDKTTGKVVPNLNNLYFYLSITPVTRSAIAEPTVFSFEDVDATDTSLFYNMASCMLYVKSAQKVSMVEIFSASTGNRVLQRGNTDQVDLSMLASGVYIAKAITTDGKMKSINFIK